MSNENEVPVPAHQQSEQREETQPGDVAKNCMDSDGYLLFAAFLTTERDKLGRPMIQHQYRRYHFSLEDSKNALMQLRHFIDQELEALRDADAEEDMPTQS